MFTVLLPIQTVPVFVLHSSFYLFLFLLVPFLTVRRWNPLLVSSFRLNISINKMIKTIDPNETTIERKSIALGYNAIDAQGNKYVHLLFTMNVKVECAVLLQNLCMA